MWRCYAGKLLMVTNFLDHHARDRHHAHLNIWTLLLKIIIQSFAANFNRAGYGLSVEYQ